MGASHQLQLDLQCAIIPLPISSLPSHPHHMPCNLLKFIQFTLQNVSLKEGGVAAPVGRVPGLMNCLLCLSSAPLGTLAHATEKQKGKCWKNESHLKSTLRYG